MAFQPTDSDIGIAEDEEESIGNHKKEKSTGNHEDKEFYEMEQNAITRKLDEISKEARKRKNKPATRKNEKPSPKKPGTPRRVATGWCFRFWRPERGPLSKCQGCKKSIDRDDPCVIYTFLKKPIHKFSTAWSFHCKGACLARMRGAELQLFKEKKWKEKVVSDVVAELE